jgi:16S rRNA (uracil1498-N3)-methyltransferase
MSQSAPRLFVDHDLIEHGNVPASEAQAHYLLTVMRRRAGEDVLVFNGRQGEWRAQIVPVGKRHCDLKVVERRRVQNSDLDVWLVFAPVKNARLEILVEKATELGATGLLPVLTERTIVRRLNLDRLRAHAVEAAEQSNRLSVPMVHEMVSLEQLIANWPADRRMIYADEIGPAPEPRKALMALDVKPCGVLIGPEGGFSTAERDRILALPDVVPMSLGPRLLRADTAALSALALTQALIGDRVG